MACSISRGNSSRLGGSPGRVSSRPKNLAPRQRVCRLGGDQKGLPFIVLILACAVKSPDVDDDQDDQRSGLDQAVTANQSEYVDGKQGANGSQLDCRPLTGVGGR